MRPIAVFIQRYQGEAAEHVRALRLDGCVQSALRFKIPQQQGKRDRHRASDGRQASKSSLRRNGAGALVEPDGVEDDATSAVRQDRPALEDPDLCRYSIMLREVHKKRR